MEDILISVIVPVYNAGEYFNKCIESIVNQTHKRLEIILVNDGSTDNSLERCRKWAERDSRILLLNKENGGAASARNAGLDAATGEYVGFIDADDYIEPDMYELMLKEILENSADAARCGINRVFDDGTVENWGGGKDALPITIDRVRLLSDIGQGEGILPASPCNKLFKRSCVGDIRFDTAYKFAEDTLFNFMVARNINKMVYYDHHLYHYVFNESSITNKKISENNFDEHRVMDEIFSLADDDILPYCIKGDVLKSFKTIRQIILDNRFNERFNAIRKRIVSNKRAIFFSGIYSRKTKLRTLLLWLSPRLYKFTIKHFR